MRNLIKITFFTMLFALIACEDDPLLAPQTDSSDDGGSYGLLILDHGKESDANEENPEIF